MTKPDMSRKCKNCGFTFGSHAASSYYSNYYNMIVRHNQCPGHEGRMDWDKGNGTVFESVDPEEQKKNESITNDC